MTDGWNPSDRDGPKALFSGLRVLDLSRWVPGEFCTKMFGDLGADVVKIERPDEGSLTRTAGTLPGEPRNRETNPLFLHLNTNKRSVTLDLRDPDGRRAVLALARHADLLVESFRPGTMERLGLGWQTLREENQHLVMTRITNFGQTGPYRDRETSTLALQATAGPMFSTGDARREPLQKPGYFIWYSVGRMAAEASLAALLNVRKGSSGTMLDVSAHEVLLGGADRRSAYLVTAAYSGANSPRGVRSPHRGGVLPTGPYACRDGFVMIYIMQQFLTPLVNLLGDTQLADFLTDPEVIFTHPQEAAAELGRVLVPWLAQRDKREIMDQAQASRIPMTAILTVDEVMTEPQFRDRGMFVRATHPVAGSLEYVGAPWRIPGGWRLQRTAPLLGEHTAEVLAGVGVQGAGGKDRNVVSSVSGLLSDDSTRR